MNAVRSYHAHVYFDAGQIDRAVGLREEIGRRFEVGVGTLYRRPVGPHPKGMFQVLFDDDQFGSIVPWLMMNRHDLDILVHPDTGDELRDHTRFVLWMGSSLALNTDRLPRMNGN